MAKFKPLSAFLDKDDAVNRLAAQAELLLRLRESAPLILPEQILQSTSIASYRHRKVVIFAENNAIAAKLRLYERQLLNLWARQGWEVSAIKVEVQPRSPRSLSAPKHSVLTPRAKRALTNLEETLPPDSPLRDAVHGLAHRGPKDRADGKD